MTDPLEGWPGFVEDVRERLEEGRTAYGDRSFERPPSELIDELEQEILDVAGWAYVLRTRLQALKAKARAAEEKGGV